VKGVQRSGPKRKVRGFPALRWSNVTGKKGGKVHRFTCVHLGSERGRGRGGRFGVGNFQKR